MGMPCQNPEDLTTCEGALCNQCSFGAGDQPDVCTKSPDGCFNCIVDSDGCDALKNKPNSDKGLCYDVYLCMRDNHCVQNGDATACWCGSAPSDPCFKGEVPANGPCLQQIIAAAKSPDPAVIGLRFINPEYPLGAAVNLANCRSNFCGKNAMNVPSGSAASCPLW